MNRYIAALVLTLCAAPAMADDVPVQLTVTDHGLIATRDMLEDPMKLLVPSCYDTYPELPSLAQRLGVKPLNQQSPSSGLIFKMCNGERYRVDQLINAFLDRIDKATKDGVKENGQ